MRQNTTKEYGIEYNKGIWDIIERKIKRGEIQQKKMRQNTTKEYGIE